jgi:hypothetical protein
MLCVHFVGFNKTNSCTKLRGINSFKTAKMCPTEGLMVKYKTRKCENPIAIAQNSLTISN